MAEVQINDSAEIQINDSIEQDYIKSREVEIEDEGAARWKQYIPPSQAETEEAEDPGDQDQTIVTAETAAPAPSKSDDPTSERLGRVASGTIREFIGIPTQMIGAVRDVSQEVIDIAGFLGDQLEKIIPLGGVKFDKDGISRQDADEFEGSDFELPDVPKSDDPIMRLGRGFMRFMIGFKGVGKAMKSAGVKDAATKGGAFLQDVMKGFAADVLVWDEHEARLSDFLREFETVTGTPILNEVTEYLSADPTDDLVEGKLKQGLEGALAAIGVRGVTELAGVMVDTFKMIRRGRMVAEGASPEKVAADLAADQVKRDIITIGDPDGPRFRTERVETPESVIRRNLDDADAPPVGQGPEPVLEPRHVPNFARIDGPEDLDLILKEMAEKNADLAKTAQGGRVSNATTADLAKSIGIEDVLTLEARRFDKAEIVALNDFYASSANFLKETAEAATRSPSEGNLFAFQKAMAVHRALLEKVMGARAEAGRTLQALRIPSDMGDLERLAQLQEVTTAMGGRDVQLAIAQKVLEAGGPVDLNAFAIKSVGARSLDAVLEAWTLGLVSGPRSQARNILGNSAYLFQSIFERGFAARLPGSQVEKGEAMAFAFGALRSFKMAMVNSGKAFASGQSGFGIGKIEAPFRKAISAQELGISGPMGYVADYVGEFYRLWGRFLGAGDEIFKTLNYNGEMSAQALRQARQAGLEGQAFIDDVVKNVQNPSEPLRVAARDAAQQGTFTAELGSVGKGLQSMSRGFPPLRFLLPFIRTPGNLFKEGFKRTPVAMAMPKAFWGEIAAGGARKDMAIAKMTMGSGMMALFSDMTLRGQVSGRGPIDKRQRSNLMATGWKPYSILMPDHPLTPPGLRGKWVNYRSIEPLGQVLGMAADSTDLLMQWNEAKDADDPDAEIQAERMVWASVSALGNSVTSQTFMRSTQDFFTMMNNPWFAERWVQRYAQTTLPRIVPSGEDVRRSFSSDAGSKEMKEIHGVMDAMQEQIPWLRDDMKPLRDLEGNPRVLTGAWGPDWLSPMYISEDKATTYQKEIIRNKVGIGRPNGVVGFTDPVTGETGRVNLREEKWADAWDHYQQVAAKDPVDALDGMNVINYLQAVTKGNHPDADLYESLPDGDENGVEDKGWFIRDAFNKSRKSARQSMMESGDWPDLEAEIGARVSRKLEIKEEFAP